MNKQLKRRVWAILCALFLMSSASFSQIDNFDFLRSAPSDATKYLQAYMAPWTNAFGAGLNGGWYNTAKPHKLGGFDITTSFNVGVVPKSEDFFDVTKIGLSSSLSSAGNLTPTISGPDKPGPSMSYMGTTFQAPQGTAWKYMPVPTLQAGIGLPLGTEVKVRFVPKINIKDGNISLWGIGLMHSLTQYLPGDKLLPFDVSIFGGYTKLTGNAPLSILADASVNYAATINQSMAFADQNMNIVVSAMNISAIASLNLPVITFYGGLGYSKTKTDIKLSGNFPVPVLVAGYPTYTDASIKTNFGNIETKNFSGLRANIGLRLKLSVITIHADYTRAQYNVLSAGLGISFR